MTREEVKELFKFLTFIYPNFEVSSEKLDAWTSLLQNQNTEKVMQRAKRYVLDNKFPPTIADLAERIDETHNSDFLEKVKQWKAEASEKH